MNPSLLIILLCAVTLSGIAQPKAKRNFVIPKYFIAKSEAYIKGPFDADGSNTVIRFENNQTESFDLRPLIEDKSKILFKVPNTHGHYELIIADEGNGEELFVPVKVIEIKTDYNLSGVDKKGKAKYSISLLGAEGINEEFDVKIKNRSPHVIGLIGGNLQNQKIRKRDNEDEVRWEGELIQLSEGNFTIICTMEQPTPSIEVQ